MRNRQHRRRCAEAHVKESSTLQGCARRAHASAWDRAINSSLYLYAAFLAGPSLAAQSTHLSRLEIAAPAVSVDPLATAAWRGWAATWVVPAAGQRVTGLLIGAERNGFAAVTSTFGVARFRAGLTWQMAFAQTQVTGLFDAELVSQYPELTTLTFRRLSLEPTRS